MFEALRLAASFREAINSIKIKQTTELKSAPARCLFVWSAAHARPSASISAVHHGIALDVGVPSPKLRLACRRMLAAQINFQIDGAIPFVLAQTRNALACANNTGAGPIP